VWVSLFLLESFVFQINIYLGISNLEECPLNRNIPVFVLVGGALALLKLLQVLWKQYNRHSEPSEEEEEATDTRNGSVRNSVLNKKISFNLITRR
jgi:TRAP-type C4-dicarboxylate transport system permease small subunit